MADERRHEITDEEFREDQLVRDMDHGEGEYEYRYELRGRFNAESPEEVIGAADDLLDTLEYIGCARGNYTHLRLVDHEGS